MLSTSSCHFDYINLIIRLVRLHYIHLSSVSLDFFFRRCRSCWADSCNSIFGSGHNDIKGRTIHNHAWEAKRADGTVAITRSEGTSKQRGYWQLDYCGALPSSSIHKPQVPVIWFCNDKVVGARHMQTSSLAWTTNSLHIVPGNGILQIGIHADDLLVKDLVEFILCTTCKLLQMGV